MFLKYPSTIEINPKLTQSQIVLTKKMKKSKSAQYQKDSKFNTFIEKSKEPFEEEEFIAPNPVDEFVKNLEIDKENIGRNVNKFWDTLKRKNKVLLRDDIIKLLCGNKPALNENGLIAHSGKIDENIIGSEACLGLISKLVNHETNPDCDNCINIIKMLRLEYIQKMNLEKHLTSNKPFVISNALKILRIFYNTDKGVRLDQILTEKTIEKFNTFFMDCE